MRILGTLLGILGMGLAVWTLVTPGTQWIEVASAGVLLGISVILQDEGKNR